MSLIQGIFSSTSWGRVQPSFVLTESPVACNRNRDWVDDHHDYGITDHLFVLGSTTTKGVIGAQVPIITNEGTEDGGADTGKHVEDQG